MAFDPISAGIGLAGGIFSAISGNKAAKQAKKDAQALAKYENDTNLLNWEFQNKVRDFEYNEQLRIYGKSKEVYGKQLDYNRDAASRSYEAENRKMDEYLQGLSFQKQDGFIQMLQARGKVAATGAVGKSSQRMSNDVLSQYGRNNAILAENLVSAKKQGDIDLENIGLQKTGADLGAYERLGLEPIKGPQAPKPLLKPVAGGSSNPLLAIGSAVVGGLSAGYYRKS